MTTSLLRTSSLLRVLGLLAATAVVSLNASCGDGPICQTEKLVFISSPQGPIIADADPGTDGIQTDVVVKSTFGRDAEIVLSVRDAEGVELTAVTRSTDRDGNVTFTDVTIPDGGAILHVEGDAGQCGSDSDEVAVSIIGGGDCAVEFATPPEANDFYAPLPVWNAAADGVAATPGYQGDAIVRARPGEQVKLFLSAPGVPEAEIGAGTTSDTGTVTLALSAPEGQVNVRAECGVTGAVAARSSGVTSVFVDTVAPTCTVVDPAPGTSITPNLDGNGDLSDGIQLTLRGNASGGDGAGEAATFTITEPGGGTTALPGTDLTVAGDSTTAATFNPPTAPADFSVRFAAVDHAGNSCSVDEPYRVVFDGCPITIVAPTGPVTTDADGNSGNGAQVDIQVSAPGCPGRTITSDCGTNDPGGMLSGAGAVTIRADVCDGVPCEASETCTVRVTSADGIETTAGVNLGFDNLAPSVAVVVSQPIGVACGGTVTPADDLDLVTAGVQIRMRVTAPAAVTRSLDITSSAGTSTVPVTGAGGETPVTIVPGANTFVGHGVDAAGNVGTSGSCVVNLADIAVNFTGSPADGLVGSADGTVGSSGLTFALTGTVSAAGATVSITVDGGAPIAATVTGTSWSASLTLADRAAPYVIVATATQAARIGSATLSLTVDLSPPTAPTGLTAVADTRQSIRLNFTAPAGAVGYRVKFATVALTDANFDGTGTAVTAPTPGAAGSAEVVRARPLHAGTAYWVAIASIDSAGNRSVAQIAGPLTPRFDQQDLAAPNTAGSASFGAAIVRGKFNNDDFEDVAISAPNVTAAGIAGAGEVYVFLGSSVGLATAPAVTIRGVTANGSAGLSLTAVHWSSPTRSDLVIGEPFGDSSNGAIYVFDGGAALPTGAVTVAAAQRKISVAASLNWFSGSALGWSLAAADHDGDGTDDLVAGAIFGNAGASGAALVFYGGTVPSGNVRISDTSAAGSGSAVIRMYEQIGSNLFGYYLHNVGPTTVADVADDLAVGYTEDGLAGAEIDILRATGGRPATPGVTREPFTVGRDVRLVLSIDALLEFGSAVGSISDQNGDGARELVLGDYRFFGDNGAVWVVDGDTVGIAGTANLSAPGVLLTQYTGQNTNDHLGMAIVNNALDGAGDVDGDGIEDLVVATRVPGTTQAALDVWFGPLPLLTSAPTPDHVITGPTAFTGGAVFGGSPIVAIWAGDVNGDGLEDICWGDWNSTALDGAVQVLWDDGN